MLRATPFLPLLRALCAGAALAFAAVALGAPVRTEHVEAELVAAKTALVPGTPLTVALRLAIDKGWHTYWQNPGDSGLPTTLDWKLPAGVKAGPIEWPAPHLLPAGPLLNYGYENEVLHLVTLTTVPDFLSGRDVTLTARADWLVCKETCIPEGADLSLTLPVANVAEPDPRWGKPIAAALAALPRPLAGWQASAAGRGTTIALKLDASLRRARSRRGPLFRERDRSHRAIGAAAARARRRQLRADAARRDDAAGRVRQPRGSGDRRQRFRRRRPGGDDRRLASTAPSARRRERHFRRRPS